MSGIATESFNIIPPYRNSTGLASQANIVVGPTSKAINLSDFFGGLDKGHFITVQADGAKLYIAIGSNDIGAIDQDAQGAGPSVCFPVADGAQLPMRILGGREVGTGYATMVQYASGVILWAKTASSGTATGFLRIYRSSVSETQGIEQLKPRGF
jgi:hypothetical protein